MLENAYAVKKFPQEIFIVIMNVKLLTVNKMHVKVLFGYDTMDSSRKYSINK